MINLRISEIFLSLQGESRTVGIPTVFVRLSGCPLRCRYCDTTYAFNGGNWMSLEAILAQVESYTIRHVTVTGGEPLAQPACLELLILLCNQGYVVSLETSGAFSVNGIDARVSRVMDLKTPGSGESKRNRYSNIAELGSNDQIKFVMCNRQDYEWAKTQLQEYNLHKRCEVLFSPVTDQLTPLDLANWILEDRLPVRFQMQLHKLLWGDCQGR